MRDVLLCGATMQRGMSYVFGCSNLCRRRRVQACQGGMALFKHNTIHGCLGGKSENVLYGQCCVMDTGNLHDFFSLRVYLNFAESIME